MYVRNIAPEIRPDIIFHRLFARRSLDFTITAQRFIHPKMIIIRAEIHAIPSLNPFA
jgi:hypothetical protein